MLIKGRINPTAGALVWKSCSARWLQFSWRDKHDAQTNNCAALKRDKDSSTIVLWGKRAVLQNSWTDILFIRGEILSSATTCDSNWSFMVPGTYWDIWIYRRGRWMAEVHDCVMWSVCVLGRDNMERKKLRCEARGDRRGDEDIFEVELLLRALYKGTRCTVRSGRFLRDKRG